jgi:hypothetical protein
MPVFGVSEEFRAQSYAFNPKLWDWEDIHNLERVKTGKDLKSFKDVGNLPPHCW